MRQAIFLSNRFEWSLIARDGVSKLRIACRHFGAPSALQVATFTEFAAAVIFANGDPLGVCGVVALNATCFAPSAFASGDLRRVCGVSCWLDTVCCAPFAFASGDPLGGGGVVVAQNTKCFAPFVYASDDSGCLRLVVWSVGWKLDLFCRTNWIRSHRTPGPLRLAPEDTHVMIWWIQPLHVQLKI